MRQQIDMYENTTQSTELVFAQKFVVTCKLIVMESAASQKYYFHHTLQCIDPILQTLDYPVLFAVVLNNTVQKKGKCQTDSFKQEV